MKPTDLNKEREQFKASFAASLKRRIARAGRARLTARGKDASIMQSEIAEARKDLGKNYSEPRRTKRVTPKQ